MELASFAIGILGLVFGVIQTVRIRNLRQIRNSHLNLIWRNLKKLSHHLLLDNEATHPRRSCGVRAQRIEENIALLIVNLFSVTPKKIKDWKERGLIDDYDYELLGKLVRQ